MKKYAKMILYAYPMLKTVERDYEEHIRNKALLSYDSRKTAVELAEYLAGEILEMRRLEWLKAKVEESIQKLNEVERTLLFGKYFGRRGELKKLLRPPRGERSTGWTERTYFRRQQRLGEKISSLFTLCGLTEEVFLREFASMRLFEKIAARVERMDK